MLRHTRMDSTRGPTSSKQRASGVNEDLSSTSVFIPRLVLGCIISTAVVFPSLYEPFVSSVWSHLSSSSWYQFSGIETIETILCYILMEIIYNLTFYHNPSLRIDIRGPHEKSASGTTPGLPKSMRWPSARLPELLTYVLPLFALDFTLVKKYAGVPLASIRHSGGYSALTSPAPSNLTFSSSSSSSPSTFPPGSISPSFLLPTFHNFSLASPAQLHRALPLLVPSSRRLVLELAAAIVIYDFLFFALHLALHAVPVLWRYHAPHHRHSEMNPQVTNQLSLFERFSLVLLANFSLNVIGSHVLTRTLFIPLFVYLLVEIHCGMQLAWGYEKLLPSGWGAGAVRHAGHHRDGGGGFEPFFRWWDAGLEVVLGLMDGKRVGKWAGKEA